ncbi:MAG: indole-3-glycerol phosphate synthase TrpC [Syntrophobacteraceae bacterium]
MNPDRLSVILEAKKKEVQDARGKVPESVLRKQAEKRVAAPRFVEALSAPGPRGANIIAEIKRGSPSKGVIREDLNAVTYAQAYERGGATAISVLTDREFFFGSPDDLRAVRASVQLPVLRKDFVVSSYQVYEAACWGADAVLLIVRALEPEQLKGYLQLSGELKLDALVEVHSLPELETAMGAGARLIGINNRDLTTFKTDLKTSVDLVKRLDGERIAVAESGIHGRADIQRLMDAGIWNFLIGESIVRAENPERFLGSLLGRSEEEEEESV